MKPLRRWLLLSLVVGPLALLLGCSGGAAADPGAGANRRAGPADDPSEAARQVFSGSPDRAACSTALQQVNAYLNNHADKRPPALTDPQKALLKERFGLQPGDVAEVESTTFTLLDAPHLELCFLMRDVARSLDADALSPEERAATAFAWTMRQVIPQEGEGAGVPPEFALRRGWGTAAERGYVFLALLQQMGVPGCFLMTPAGAPWACGALVEVEGSKEKQVLVFDHRAGLPLPGAKGAPDAPLARAFRLALPVAGPRDGTPIATLAALRKQPELLKQLTVDEKFPYGVTADQLKDTVVRLAVPLSALSPRMKTLQEQFLPERAGLRPAVDPGDLVEQFGAAAGVEGGAGAVREREGSAALTRRFLPESEGGTDKGSRSALARLAMFPQDALPRPIQELEGERGERIRLYALQQALVFQMEPQQPRDLVLRGQFQEASTKMVPLLEQIRTQKDILDKKPEVYDDFERWKNNLFEAFGKVDEAREALRKGGAPEAVEAAEAMRERIWQAGMPTLALLVEGGTAESRRAQVMYQQGLCMHEQAERAQARADAAARAQPPAETDEVKAAREKALTAWKDAASWLTNYTQLYPRTPQGIQARLLLARVREAQGQPDVSRALLEHAPPDLSQLNRVNRLYLARRLKAP